MVGWIPSRMAQAAHQLRRLQSDKCKQNKRTCGSALCDTACGGHSKNGPEAPSVQRTSATLQSVVDTESAFQNPETEWIDDPGDLPVADNRNKPAKTRSVLQRLVRGSAIAACQCMTLGL